jgi:N-acetylglucosaminyldiphosphoundecaprenol N-acetyl-beta-D-mannosaminyltransferase
VAGARPGMMSDDVETGRSRPSGGPDGMPAPQMIGVLPVQPWRLPELLAWLQERMAGGDRVTVLYANAHAANLARRDPVYRAAFSAADVVFCDGQGLRWGAGLLGRPLPERFTPPDWIDRLLSLPPTRDGGVFFLGGHPEVLAQALRTLQARHPELRAGGHHGYFRRAADEEQAVIEAVRSFRPALLLVGLGMPVQERWVTAHRDELAADVVMTVGALIDYLAGAVPRGPRWLTDHGFEWLCRLWFEPRRLWRRYLFGNPAFVVLVARQALAERMWRLRRRDDGQAPTAGDR